MSERTFLNFEDMDFDGRCWVDREHIIAVVPHHKGSTLYLTNGRTLVVDGDTDTITDRILGLEDPAPEPDEEVSEDVFVYNPAAIREWARERGMVVPERGPVPSTLVEAYKDWCLQKIEDES